MRPRGDSFCILARILRAYLSEQKSSIIAKEPMRVNYSALRDYLSVTSAHYIYGIDICYEARKGYDLCGYRLLKLFFMDYPLPE